MATAPGLSKVFIIDKYFTELQKYWETEKKMKGRKVKEMGRFNNPSVTGDDKPTESSSSDVYDLIHLQGPLTEDSIVRALDARFLINEYLTNIGLLVLAMNGYERKGNPVTLASVHHDAPKYPQLLRIAQDAVRQQSETGYPQAIILSGESGSGKTYCCMLLLRHLFDAAGGGPETDSFKHLSAAFTVLKSLGSAKTSTNSESSRVGQFIEVQITDGALYRTKIHCYYLDQTRVLKQYPNEKNYHIFYQMLAGLTKDERAKLNLEGYTVNNLRYLNRGDTSQNETEDAARFEAWKASLSVLGIPFMDVVRVLSAILLLGNVKFNDGHRHNPVFLDSSNIGFLDSKANSNEIKAVASLLGVSSVSLYRGLTTRTQSVRGQLVKSVCDSQTASNTRDGLAKALYCRTVATIVRRANSLKRIGSTCGTMSSDSNESIHNQIETGSHHASTVGSSGAKSQKSLNVLNSAVRHATDGFIGILDMFGFEDSHPSHLEHLCINLCAETMQHYYNTIIFKTSMESCQEEGVSTDFQVDYVDNVPCIDFISSLRTGLLEMLDVETFLKGTPESYVGNIKAQHHGCPRYFDVDWDYDNQGKTNNKNNKHKSKSHRNHHHHHNHHRGNIMDKMGKKQHYADNLTKNNYSNQTLNNNNNDKNNNNNDESISRFFGVRHFTGNVVYDTSDFIEANRDTIPDDIVAVFHKSSCTFGFASHLFGTELKTLFSRDLAPCGLRFRISPTNHNNLQHGNDITTTLTQDFHTRLDNLLRTIVHAKPHFIRCIKSNNEEQKSHFDRPVVMRQLRSLQVLETLNLMACGLPHRMRFRAFTMRYRCIGPMRRLKKIDDKSSADDCKILLDSFTSALEQFGSLTPASNSWAIGKRHIFLSEGARQQLELLRNAKRAYAAVIIQAAWRGWNQRKRWPSILNNNINNLMINSMINGGCGKRFLGKSGSTHSTSLNQHHHHHHGLSTPGGVQPSGLLSTSLSGLNRPRPQPITGTPPPEPCDAKIIAHTCSLFGLDLQRPPPVPPSRSYTVTGNAKLGYPQTRTMKLDYPEVPTGSEPQLSKGEIVMVIGASSKRGHLIVDHGGHTFHVPYQYMELKSYPTIATVTSPPASL